MIISVSSKKPFITYESMGIKTFLLVTEIVFNIKNMWKYLLFSKRFWKISKCLESQNIKVVHFPPFSQMPSYFLSCVGNVQNFGLLSVWIKIRVNPLLLHNQNPITVYSNLRSSYSKIQTEQYVIHLRFIFLGRHILKS